MTLTLRILACVLTLSSGSAAAQANPESDLAFLDNIQRHGFGHIADLYPDIVHFHTAGNGCRTHTAGNYRDLIPTDPAAQTRNGLCTLEQMMREARTGSDSVVEARITVRRDDLADIVREVVENDPRFSGLEWDIKVDSQLTIDNEDVVLSIDVAKRHFSRCHQSAPPLR